MSTGFAFSRAWAARKTNDLAIAIDEQCKCFLSAGLVDRLRTAYWYGRITVGKDCRGSAWPENQSFLEVLDILSLEMIIIKSDR